MLEKTGTVITKCPFCKQGTLVVASGIPKHSDINSYDIIFINQPKILVNGHCGELFLKSPYKFGIAFLRSY
jgi:hypothetical protein